jgi:hypothetical protein
VSRGTQDAASSPVHFPLRDCHTLWPRFPAGSRSVRIVDSTYAVLQPPCVNTWVWAFPISLAATFGISVIYFPSGTEMVHFPELAHTGLCIQPAVTGVHPVGFPHSDIPGSKPACGSPRLFAACHVLHRLLAPRHPLYALSSLIIKLTQYVVSRGARNRLRFSELTAVAIPRLSIGSFALFPADPLFRGPLARRRDCRLYVSRRLTEFALLNPQYCSTYSSRTCNKSCPHSPRQTVIGPELSA